MLKLPWLTVALPLKMIFSRHLKVMGVPPSLASVVISLSLSYRVTETTPVKFSMVEPVWSVTVPFRLTLLSAFRVSVGSVTGCWLIWVIFMLYDGYFNIRAGSPSNEKLRLLNPVPDSIFVMRTKSPSLKWFPFASVLKSC